MTSTLSEPKRISAAEYRKQAAKKKPRKYRNKITDLDGITFDSELESQYYAHLKQREKAGEVYEVDIQRPFACVVNGYLVCTLIVDFTFYDAIQKRNRAADTKFICTKDFIIKRKLVKAIYGIDVEIVKKGEF